MCSCELESGSTLFRAMPLRPGSPGGDRGFSGFLTFGSRVAFSLDLAVKELSQDFLVPTLVGPELRAHFGHQLNGPLYSLAMAGDFGKGQGVSIVCLGLEHFQGNPNGERGLVHWGIHVKIVRNSLCVKIDNRGMEGSNGFAGEVRVAGTNVTGDTS